MLANSCKTAALMLRAYFDDSGTHADSDVVVVGGVLGTPEQWEVFQNAWAAKLACPLPGKPSLRKFGLADCNSGKGEFISYNQAERDAAMHDFRQVLVDAQLIGTASAIERKAWDALVVGDYRTEHGSAIEVCVQNCLVEAMKIAGPHPSGDTIAVVFDRGIWSQRLKDITDALTFPLGRPRIVSVNFLEVAHTLGLQGADTIATENYWHASAWIGAAELSQPRPHLRHFLARMRTEGLILDRELIVSMLKETDGRRAKEGKLS
jgi:hypothetical protein